MLVVGTFGVMFSSNMGQSPIIHAFLGGVLGVGLLAGVVLFGLMRQAKVGGDFVGEFFSTSSFQLIEDFVPKFNFSLYNSSSCSIPP